MGRREPPSSATWMLEHLTPSDRDEALGGDLLEEFRGGRSDAWYWRQVLAACAISWLRSIQARLPLLVFTLLWSMLAPAWKVFCDRIESAPILDRIWQMAGGVWVFPALAVWTVLHSTFLWAGMLVYISSQTSFGATIHREKLRRAFLLAPLIFPPIYAATFIWGNLYWYSFFANAKLATTPLGQIADLRMLADVMRVPYFIALLCALWGAIPQSTHSLRQQFVESTPAETSTQADSLALVSRLGPFSLRRFFGLMVGAGLVNALIAGFLLCRLPESHAPTLGSLLIRGILYVAVGALAGVAGTWAYWKSPASPFCEHSPVPFPLFALICAAGWVWVPSMVIFSEQASAAASFVAMIGAFMLTSGLRGATYFVFAPAQSGLSILRRGEHELFSESLYRSPAEAYGYAIAICLYAAGAALLTGSNYTAAALLASSASLFAWKRTIPRRQSLESEYEYKQAAVRLAVVAVLAVLVTIWALLDGVAHRNRDEAMNATLAAGDGIAASEKAGQKTQSKSSAYGLGGYQSLILWPFPQKKQIVPPLPPRESFLAPGTTRPLIIPFSGAYWYVQPPDELPGPAAHQARGTPLGTDIESNNFVPLVMDAHQTLGAPILTAGYREIQVEIENHDNRRGVIAMAVLLGDAASPRKPALYLGQQPIPSTQPAHFSSKSVPVFETLRFSIPADAKMRSFNEITVMMLPDVEHALVAPKIALRQFQLLPR